MLPLQVTVDEEMGGTIWRSLSSWGFKSEETITASIIERDRLIEKGILLGHVFLWDRYIRKPSHSTNRKWKSMLPYYRSWEDFLQLFSVSEVICVHLSTSAGFLMGLRSGLSTARVLSRLQMEFLHIAAGCQSHELCASAMHLSLKCDFYNSTLKHGGHRPVLQTVWSWHPI